MSLKNFVVKNGLTVGNATIDAATGNLISGNANLGNLATANYFAGNANALFNIQGANVVGTVANANYSAFAGVVTTNAQPNITSVGTLSSLSVSGNASVGGILTNNYYYANGAPVDFQQAAGSNSQIQYNLNGDFGASANFTFNATDNTLAVTGNANVTGTVNTANINSGSSAFTLTANGQTTNFYANGIVAFPANVTAPNFIGNVVGNITGNIAAQGSNTQVQFNDDGLLGASANFTFNKATNVLTVTGNIVSTNANLGNLATANYVNVANDVTVIGNVAAGNVNAGNLLTANYLTGTLTTAAQPNITSVGSLSSLTVTGNASAGNVNAGNLLTANYLTGTLTTNAQPNITSVGILTSVDVTGNVTAGNVYANTGTVGALLLTGTLTTNAQPNVTSVGTLSSLAVTGNVTAGNVGGGNLVSANYFTGTLTTNAQPNITSVGTLSSLDVTGNITTGANLVTDLIVGKTTSVTITATGVDSNIFLKPTGNGTVDVWGKIISNVATPLADYDAATKKYVDDVAQGLNIHDAAKAATPNTLAVLSGGTVTYNNGTAGVGATLTTTGSYTTIDGINIATVGTRILVKNEANAAHNGIYVYTSSTVLTRADDYNTVPEVEAGDFVFVQDGTTYNDTGWVQTSTVTTIGTDPIEFTQFSGAGTYTAGTGLTLAGTQFSISNTAVTAGTYGNGDAVASFQVNAQGQLVSASNVNITANAANLTGTTLSSTITNSSLTSVGTLGSLSVTGNISAGNVNAGNLLTANYVAGTLTTNAQPNITSVGILTSLDVTGNVGAGNVNGGNLVTANYVAGTLTTAAQPNITSVGILTSLDVTGNANAGNINGGNLVTANFFAGTLTTASQPNVTSLGQLTSLDVTGNLLAGNVYANSGTIGANLLTGTLTTNAQPNVTSVGTLTSLAVTGNVTAGNVTGANLVSANYITGTLTTNAQPNITSVGTLTSLDVTGNASAGNLSSGNALSVTGNANIGNIGTAQVLATANVTTPQLIANVANGTAPLVVNSQTLVANLNADLLDGYNSDSANTANTIALRDANGNLSANYFIGNGAYLTGIDTSLIANGNSNVSVAANGNVTISVAGNSAVAVFTGTGANINGYANVTGNLTSGNADLGNLAKANYFSGTLDTLSNAQPNITSVGTLTSLSVSGTITGGNIFANSGTIGANLLTGTLTTAAQPNVTSVGNLTSLTIAANGNINMSGAESTLSGANLVSANLLTGTLTTAAQPNVTSVGTLSSLTTSGNVTVGGNVKVQVGITSNRANVAVGATATVIDQFSPSDWRTAKYVISGSGDDGYQSVEVILVHDGVDSYVSIYGSVCSNNAADLITLSSNINGVTGNVTVYATSDSDNCYVNLVSSYIKT